ncbi:MAG: hypothetical protein IPK77_10480 [Cellvibrio sp.]|nr:hypothetical protein [Cellvibrio sp.]
MIYWPESKMRRRWRLHYYKPSEIVYEILKRASKYKTIVWPDCRGFIERLCNKYSKRPDATIRSLMPSHLFNEQLFIKDGFVINQYDAERRKEVRLWQEKIDSGLKSFWHAGELFCRCECCGMYEIEAFSWMCVKCSKNSMKLYKKECEIKEIKSLINKVNKLCQNQLKQPAI